MPGRLIVCPTPIGNLDDVTPRVRDALVEADYIACEDTRRTGRLLDQLRIRPAPRLVSNHEGNEAARATELAQRIERGDVVTLVSDAGMPAISDPGYRLIRRCIDRDLDVRCCPAPPWCRLRSSPPGFRPIAGASRASSPSAPARWSGCCARPRRWSRSSRRAGRRLPGGARGDRSRPPGRGLPRALEAARGGRPRHPWRTGAALPRRRQGRDRPGHRAGRPRGARHRRRLRGRRPAPPRPVRRSPARGGQRRRGADRDPRQRPLQGADRSRGTKVTLCGRFAA